MGFALFDKANLAVVAYAKVAADGTLLAASNLEYRSPHGPGGQYVLGPPVNLQGVREPMFDDTTITLVTQYEVSPQTQVSVAPGGPDAIVISFQPLYAPGPPVDKAFAIVVLRPLIKAPTP
jgi:hypothetical protein